MDADLRPRPWCDRARGCDDCDKWSLFVLHEVLAAVRSAVTAGRIASAGGVNRPGQARAGHERARLLTSRCRRGG